MISLGTLFSKRIALELPSFLLGYAVLNALIYNIPLYRFAGASLEGNNSASAALFTLFTISVMLTLALLGVVSLLSVQVAKWVAVVLVLCNSIAVYFVSTYGIKLDFTMMGNVLNTRSDEAWAYFHWRVIAYFVLLGVLPALALAGITIKPLAWIKRFAFVLLSVLLCSVLIYVNARSWLWIDRNAKALGGLLMPWSYTVNAARYVSSIQKPMQAALLPSATIKNQDPIRVVLIIGESARAQNFSLYGYSRLTNPELSKSGVIALPNVSACATYTTQALRCILSHEGSNAPLIDKYENLASYVQRHGVRVSWLTNNFGEPAMTVAVRQSVHEIQQTDKERCNEDCVLSGLDTVMLAGLETQLSAAQQAKKSLIVLHQTGSHGPQYFRKYPASFEKFTPACKTVDQSQCSTQDLINAYDNTILFTDYFLAQVIAQLKSADDLPTVMLYLSDHGESLGEYGLYLHGTPYAIAPDVQKKVPFVVWMSESFTKTRELKPLKSEYSHSYIFHSVLGALGLTSSIYRSELDIFKP